MFERHVSPKKGQPSPSSRGIAGCKLPSVPCMLLDSTGYEIGGGKGHKGPGHHRATTGQGKADPLENFPQVVRTRDVVKQPVADRDRVASFSGSRFEIAQAPEGGIRLGVDRHAGGGQGEAA